jgi:hypothetical protein
MNQPPEKSASPLPIPEQHAFELRRLAHDLSNALEIIVQTTYLLQISATDDQSAQWVKMLDEGVQKAVELNLQLRTYLKKNS